MRVFIVHAHAEPKSFNGALTQAAHQALLSAGHEVQISDLYAMKFDPVSDRRNFTTTADPEYYKQQGEEMLATKSGGFARDVEAEMEKLEWCDALIFQFPLWWFGLPGILKGWVDRVFAMGRIYGAGRWYDNGVFQGKRAMLSVTTGGSSTSYSEQGLNGDMQQILFPINHGILRFCGFDVLPSFLVYGPARISQEEREKHLARYRETVLSLQTTTPIAYHALREYDENLVLRAPS